MACLSGTSVRTSSCPIHATKPKNNATWWAYKLAGNVVRDRDTDTRLIDAGWAVVRVWEHEDPATAADRVDEALRAVIRSVVRK